MPRLNAASVKSLAVGLHSDGECLYLRVTSPTARSWVYVGRHAGKRVELGLGPAAVVSLKEAREAAAACRRRQHAGHHPRPVVSTVPTFGEAADDYVAAHRAGWRNAKHGAQWAMTLTTYCAPIRAVPVDRIGVDHVLTVLRPLWNTRGETADRTRGRIAKVLAAAEAKGHRAGDNPAAQQRIKHILGAPTKRKRHHPALPFADLPRLMAALRTRDSLSALALQFTILTAARTSEAIGARWCEIDMKAGVWTVPAERAKAHRLHRVPLSAAAMAILHTVRPLHPEWVFPAASGRKPISTAAMTRVVEHLAWPVPITVHGFRSTFRDWVGEACPDVPAEHAEHALAHRVGNATERAYRRGDALDPRRALMERWAHHAGAR